MHTLQTYTQKYKWIDIICGVYMCAAIVAICENDICIAPWRGHVCVCVRAFPSPKRGLQHAAGEQPLLRGGGHSSSEAALRRGSTDSAAYAGGSYFPGDGVSLHRGESECAMRQALREGQLEPGQHHQHHQI